MARGDSIGGKGRDATPKQALKSGSRMPYIFPHLSMSPRPPADRVDGRPRQPGVSPFSSRRSYPCRLQTSRYLSPWVPVTSSRISSPATVPS